MTVFQVYSVIIELKIVIENINVMQKLVRVQIIHAVQVKAIVLSNTVVQCLVDS